MPLDRASELHGGKSSQQGKRHRNRSHAIQVCGVTRVPATSKCKMMPVAPGAVDYLRPVKVLRVVAAGEQAQHNVIAPANKSAT